MPQSYPTKPNCMKSVRSHSVSLCVIHICYSREWCNTSNSPMGKHALLLKKLQRALFFPASKTISGSISNNNGSVSRERVHNTMVPRSGFESIYLRLKDAYSIAWETENRYQSFESLDPAAFPQQRKMGWEDMMFPGNYERHENKGESMPNNKKMGVSPLTTPLHQCMASGVFFPC